MSDKKTKLGAKKLRLTKETLKDLSTPKGKEKAVRGGRIDSATACCGTYKCHIDPL